MSTIFTKIINNELPSFTVYEDNLVKVFLDINPSTNGDLLLIPKKEIGTIDEVDSELLFHFHKVILLMKKLVEDKLNAQGLTIAINNGHGQEIKHFHIHLTPCYEDDLFKHTYNKNSLKPLEDIHETLIK